jgi:hypothetical protein
MNGLDQRESMRDTGHVVFGICKWITVRRPTIKYSVHSHTYTVTFSSQHPQSLSFHQLIQWYTVRKFEVFLGRVAIVLTSTFRKSEGGGGMGGCSHRPDHREEKSRGEKEGMYLLSKLERTTQLCWLRLH